MIHNSISSGGNVEVKKATTYASISSRLEFHVEAQPKWWLCVLTGKVSQSSSYYYYVICGSDYEGSKLPIFLPMSATARRLVALNHIPTTSYSIDATFGPTFTINRESSNYRFPTAETATYTLYYTT